MQNVYFCLFDKRPLRRENNKTKDETTFNINNLRRNYWRKKKEKKKKPKARVFASGSRPFFGTCL